MRTAALAWGCTLGCWCAVASADPIRCYERADSLGLEESKAVNLCVGAQNDGPAACFDAADDQVPLITDLQALRLCRGAQSAAPAQCVARLEDTTGLERTEIIGYCAAQRHMWLPSGDPGAPACVEAALDRTLLVETEAVQLCRGSESTAPVDCFERGEDTLLEDREIVTLCQRVVPVTRFLRGTY